jgi:hypothetical protein
MKNVLLTTGLLLLAACAGETYRPCDTPEAAECGRGEDRMLAPVSSPRPEPKPEPEPEDETFVFENDGSGLFYNKADFP